MEYPFRSTLKAAAFHLIAKLLKAAAFHLIAKLLNLSCASLLDLTPQSLSPSAKLTHCCSGDLYNGAKVPMVSAIMLLACVLVAFLR